MAWDFISKAFLLELFIANLTCQNISVQISIANLIQCCQLCHRKRMHIDRWYKLQFSGALGSQRTPINSSIFWLKTAHYNPHENYTRISVANWCCLLQWATPHILYERNSAWFERPRINWLCTHTPQRENINLGSLHAGTMQTIPLNYSVMTYDPKTLEMFSHLPV